MPYAVEFKPSALRALRRLPAKMQRRIAEKIDALALTPRPAGCKAIHGLENLTRVRAGDYRIVYQINDPQRRIVIARIGHRGEVYRF